MVNNELLVPFRQGDKWGFSNYAKEIIIPCIYESVEIFSEGFAAIRKNSKYGYINTFGEVVVPCRYENAEIFSEGYAAVKLNSKYGFIDTTGKVTIPIDYCKVGSFANGVAEFAINLGRKNIYDNNELVWGLIDNAGKEILPAKYKIINNKINQIIVNERRQFTDCHGKISTRLYKGLFNIDNCSNFECIYRELIPFGEDYFLVSDYWPKSIFNTYVKDGVWGLIDKKGNIVLPMEFASFVRYLDDELIWAEKCEMNVKSYEGNLKTGDTRIEKTFGEYVFKENHFGKYDIKENKRGLWSLYNLSGETINLDPVNYFTKVSESSYLIEKDLKYDIVKINVMFPFYYNAFYDKVEPLNDIFLKVSIEIPGRAPNFPHFLNGVIAKKTGSTVVLCEYDNIEIISKSLIKVSKDYRNYNGTFTKYGLYDFKGSMNLFCIYDHIALFSENLLVVYNDDKCGICDFNGKFSLPISYERISRIKNNSNIYVLVKDGLSGICDGLFQPVLACEFDFIDCNTLTKDNIPIKKNMEWGYLNFETNQIANISIEVEEALPFEQGLARVKYKGKWGLLDTNFNIIVPCLYNEISNFKFGYASFSINDNVGLIDITGNIIVQGQYKSIEAISDNTAIVGIMNEEKFNQYPYTIYGLIDFAGKVILPIEYNEICKINAYLFAIQNYNCFWGIINNQGTIILNCKYSSIRKIRDNYIIADKDSRDYKNALLFIRPNLDCKIIENTLFSKLNDDEDLIIIEKYENDSSNKVYLFLDKEGNEVIHFEVENVVKMHVGKFISICNNGKWGLINNKGVIIIPCWMEIDSTNLDNFGRGYRWSVSAVNAEKNLFYFRYSYNDQIAYTYIIEEGIAFNDEMERTQELQSKFPEVSELG